MREWLRSLLLAGAVLAAGATAGAAQDEAPQPTGQSYLTPFPEGDVYRFQVYGDPYSDGLLAGLFEAFGADNRVQFQRRARPIGPLVKSDWEDEIRQEESARDTLHGAILVIGLLDRQNLRATPGARPFALGGDDWQMEWNRRLDRLLKVLKRRAGAVYVVGQPALRRPEASRDAEMLTELIRDRAQVNGVRFIDISEGFQDENGNYIQFGADVAGVRQRLREGDGVTMTPAGNRKLASYVERELRRDMAQAQAERTIPLAGSEAEQKRINPARAAPATAAAPAAHWRETVNRATRPEAPTPANATESGGDQKADNGRVQFRVAVAPGREETVTLDIVRPAIPAAVIALLSRRDVSERAQQPGETVVEEVGGGLAVMNTVSMLGPSANAVARGRNSPANRPYVAVLVRGERPINKPGRADDFTWPRADAIAQPPPAEAQTPAPRPAPQRGPGRNSPTR